jgi:hypothetical protein
MTLHHEVAISEWPGDFSRNDLLPRIREAQSKSIRWITTHIADDGTPEGADIANSWWRAPWALVIAGEPEIAAAVIGWAERNALTEAGDLRDGPFGGGGVGTPTYQLSPIAIASWLLARYDTATAVMDRLQHWTDSATGGAYEFSDFTSNPLQDSLKTAQLGISALVTGRVATSDRVFRWLQSNYDSQPSLPDSLYTGMSRGTLVTDFPEPEAFVRVVKFQEPRQTYFVPGIAGAFLAGYYQQTGKQDALTLGQKFLDLTKNGTDEQFDDTSSVQICKFGWGVAAMHVAAPQSGQLRWVVRMAEWFIRRQRPDGAWAPSEFMTPKPGVLDLFWKTAEHLMELSYIEQALAATPDSDD